MFEADVGIALKRSLIKVGDTMEVSVGSFAFRPFWRYITTFNYDEGGYDRPDRKYAVSCRGSGRTKNCSANWDFKDTQYYYLPGDRIRMLVYSPKPNHLQLQIQLIEVSTLPSSIQIREENGWEQPQDFISPVFSSPGHGTGIKVELKRVNAIDQVANEGKPVIATTTEVDTAIWHNTYLHRKIDGEIFRVPMNANRAGVMTCPDPTMFTITAIDYATGGQSIAIHPSGRKEDE